MGRFRSAMMLWLLRGVLAVVALALPSLASASDANLRGALRVSHTGPAGASSPDWTWLSLRDTRALRELPGGWVLHVDQVRFQTIAIVATTRDGAPHQIVHAAGDLRDNWAPGGVLAFTIAPRGADIVRLDIGLEGIDDPGLLRKVSALTPHEAAQVDDSWLLLMGVFSGLMVSALVYNLFVYAGQRYAFQRWYLGWVPAALVYGLTWTNLAGYLVPPLVGPYAVRLDALLVGLVVALGSNFLVSVLEEGTVPPLLRRIVRTVAVLCASCGVLAAADALVDAALTDRLLNLAMLASVCTSLVTALLAARRGSRVVWLYLIGWAPLIAVFACRAARNFGLAGQSDLIDMATFAAIGFESLVFSLVIADRFMALRRQRDAAEASARGLEIERETLRRAAHADFLTGLGNRAFFHERMRELFEAGTPFNLHLLDVDYLKELNDRQGHDAGDALLQHIGAQLAELEDGAVSCARIGGDEFAILQPGSREDAARVVEALDALQGTVWARYSWSGMLSLSIGTAASLGAMSTEDLFQRADIALYEAKKHGRGRCQLFDEGLQQQIQSRIDLIKQAHWGLSRGEFILHFQPIVDVRTSSLVSVEALLRWNHPTLGLIAPGAFPAVLADQEIGAALQQHVIDLAIAELRRRPQFTGTLAVNFTAMDLRGRGAAEKLLAKLRAAGVPAASLCVEVTEGIILGKAGTEPAEALRMLHEAGVHISLDDFGTGYASLVHLKEIPVDSLKIDRSFVAGLLEEGDESEEIVRAVLALGHGLNKQVVAEGIETIGQLIRLRELGCDQAQGYLFGRPSPAFPRAVKMRAAA
jgi:diguanylate cyclase (GGDEF)-like protein